MKIVLSIGGFGEVDGSAELLTTYALELQARGHQPLVLLANAKSPDNKYYRKLSEAGIRVHHVTGHPLYTVLRIVRRISLTIDRLVDGIRIVNWEDIASWTCWYYLKRHRPDVLHNIRTDASTPGLIRAANAAGIPVLFQEVVSPRRSEGSGTLYDRLAEVLPLCAGVAALSPAQAAEARERIPYDGAVSVLPLISDCHPGRVAAGGPHPDGLVFGFAGRFEHWKGPLVLLDAFALVLQKFPNSLLRMAGAGPQKEEVLTHARTLGIVGHCDFAGPFTDSEERQSFLQSIDVLVQPSFVEGTPNTVAEAMAFGLPIVASAVGGIPDVISSDSGILVPAGNAFALAQALNRVAADSRLRSRLGAMARQRYERLFSPECVMPLLLEAYERIAAKKKGTTDLLPLTFTPSKKHGTHPWAPTVG